MPSFHARSLDVRLSVAGLSETITQDPVTRLSQEGTDNAERAAKAFEDVTTDGILAETPLSVDKDGCRLSYLGGTPFLMVHAKLKSLHQPIEAETADQGKPSPLLLVVDSPGSPLSNATSSPLSTIATPDGSLTGNEGFWTPKEASGLVQLDGGGEVEPAWTGCQQSDHMSTRSRSGDIRRSDPTLNIDSRNSQATHQDQCHSQPSSASDTQALCLRIAHGSKSFFPSQDTDTARWHHKDLKVDIYLNGDLTVSTVIEGKSRNHPPSIFSGARIGRLIERPWILVPAARHASEVATTSNGAAQAPESATYRWSEVANALEEVVGGMNRNNRNELPPTGQYLQSLASVPMPDTLHELLTAASEAFAVIDVVLTTGVRGMKSNRVNYLASPMPLIIQGYDADYDTSPRKIPDHVIVLEPTPEPSSQRRGNQIKSKADEQTAKQAFLSPHLSRRRPRGVTNGNDGGTNTPDGPIGEPGIHHSFDRLALTEQEQPTSTSSHSTPNPFKPPALRRQGATLTSPGSEPRATERTRTATSKRRTSVTPATIHSITPTATAPSGSQRSKKSKRFHYHKVLTTQQTLEEQMDQRVRNAEEEVRNQLNRTEPVTETETPSVSAGARATMSRAMQAPQTTRAIKPKLKMGKKNEQMSPGRNTPTSSHTPTTRLSTASVTQVLLPPPAPNDNDSSSPERPLIQSYMPRNPIPPTESNSTPLTASTTTVANLPPHGSQRCTPIGATSTRTPTSTGIPIGSTHPKQSPLTKRPGRWQPSALCQGSVVRYAEGEEVRQVKGERIGWFAEDEVVVGVRFVVG